MDWSERESQILQWACEGPGIDLTSRECDASQDELLDLISRLENELYDYNKLVLKERKWKLRWKSWASWAWSINYTKPRGNIKPGILPTTLLKQARAEIQRRIAAAKNKK